MKNLQKNICGLCSAVCAFPSALLPRPMRCQQPNHANLFCLFLFVLSLCLQPSHAKPECEMAPQWVSPQWGCDCQPLRDFVDCLHNMCDKGQHMHDMSKPGDRNEIDDETAFTDTCMKAASKLKSVGCSCTPDCAFSNCELGKSSTKAIINWILFALMFFCAVSVSGYTCFKGLSYKKEIALSLGCLACALFILVKALQASLVLSDSEAGPLVGIFAVLSSIFCCGFYCIMKSQEVIEVQMPDGATPGQCFPHQLPSGKVIMVKSPEGQPPGSTFKVRISVPLWSDQHSAVVATRTDGVQEYNQVTQSPMHEEVHLVLETTTVIPEVRSTQLQ